MSMILPPLLLWLDASTSTSLRLWGSSNGAATRILQWQDTAGGHTATAWSPANINTPWFNQGVRFTNPAPMFSQSNQMLEVQPSIVGSFVRSVVIAFRLVNEQDPQSLFRQVFEGGGPPASEFFVRFGRQFGAAIMVCNQSVRAVPLPTATLSLNVTHVVTVINTNDALSVWVDDNLIGADDTSVGHQCVSTPSSRYPLATIGGWYADNSFVAGGTIGEMMFFDGELSPVARSDVSIRLLGKWRAIWGA